MDQEQRPEADPVTSCVDCDQCSCGSGCSGCCSSREPRGKLSCCNYLSDIPGGMADDDMVEVQFKNTRKGYYLNSQHLSLKQGDMVAVEAQPGHDIGEVTLTGQLVRLQMRKAGVKPGTEIKRVFRKARPQDLEKYEEARAREHPTMIRARQLADGLSLDMKIGDVEFQGDGSKAIFYYISDQRVDFRQLIRILAENFKVRIEMKQIGARQEAGRIGAIGSCGRPLCCSQWMNNFVSVGTAAARYQDISLNPMKLAGQCGKLKCCLNFEMDTYVEAVKQMPPKDTRLETADQTYYHFKSDIFKKEITYSTDKKCAKDLVVIPASRAFEVIEMNKNGEKPEQLSLGDDEDKKPRRADLLDQDSLTRFDKKKKKKRRKPAQEPQADGSQESASNQPKQPKQPQPTQKTQAPKDGEKTQNPQNQQRRRPKKRQGPKPQGPQQTTNSNPAQ